MIISAFCFLISDLKGGSNSGVESQPSKLLVAGSNPVSRSKKSEGSKQRWIAHERVRLSWFFSETNGALEERRRCDAEGGCDGETLRS